ncbi:MAG TPA: metallopeptidase TldD-related protein [Polyangiaceae bacterium]|nr:metallopeptidase TldD-related protein [Polyangiaceae bacterium]
MEQDDSRELLKLAAEVVERARRAGADVAEASARGGSDLSTRVRMGKPELVEEAGHHSISLRVIVADRVALTSTSDLSARGIERCVADALMLAQLSEPDPFAAPADKSLLAQPPFPDLDLFDESLFKIDAARAIEQASIAEQAAFDFDPRIKLSEGATFSRSNSTSAIVLSSGFQAALRGSYASLTVAPVVEDEGGKKRRGHYWSATRHQSELEDPKFVGQEAARRTLAKLNPRKVATQETTVIFDSDVSRSLIGAFVGCILGGAVWRKSSYLTAREGTEVASPGVTLIDDPLIPRAPGSRPFDGEGLPARKNVVVDAGVLKTFLLDSYSARKLQRASTGSAARGGGSISASTSNLIMQPGPISREQLIESTPSGLYVTEMMGFGFNAMTSDFSRGAAGFWIENGKFAFPVSEITISSTLDAMLKGIDGIANDLRLITSIAAPTFRTATMTISGS